jgi:hypothetical protein
MSNLMEMLQDELYETGDIENTIDNNEEISEDISANLNESTENSGENNDMENEEVSVFTVNFSQWLHTHSENLVYTKIIDTTQINDLNDNIVILKNIDDNKETILLYKNATEYKVANLNPIYMKLFGESGFHILYNINDTYKLKLYGAKSTVYQTMCISVDDKLYPIFCSKCNKSKLEDTCYTNININRFNEFINNNTNYNYEDIVLQYEPLSKLNEPFTNKRDMLNWLYEKSLTIYDISHIVKLDNVMKTVLFQ